MTGFELAPDFFIIGAPRAGTTWLAEVIRRHPAGYVATCKETKYFSSILLRLAVDWYFGQFAAGVGQVKGEATPSYAILPLSRIQLIRKLNPALKVIYIVREPGERLISTCHHVLPQLENMSSEEIVSFAFSDGPVAASDYAANLQRWLSVFAKEQIRVLFYDDLLRDPKSFAQAALAFLELDVDARQSELLGTRLNASQPRGNAASAVRNLYPSLFAARLQQLRRLLERNFPETQMPYWLDRQYLAAEKQFHKAQQLPDGKAMFFVEGRYVYGPEDAIASCQSLAEVRALADGYQGVGVGFFWNEAVTKGLILENFENRCLSSLADSDVGSNDMYLVRSGRFGWNIVYYRKRFYCLHLSIGHIDLRIATPQDLEQLYNAGKIRIFETLQEAGDFTALSEQALIVTGGVDMGPTGADAPVIMNNSHT